MQAAAVRLGDQSRLHRRMHRQLGGLRGGAQQLEHLLYLRMYLHGLHLHRQRSRNKTGQVQVVVDQAQQVTRS